MMKVSSIGTYLHPFLHEVRHGLGSRARRNTSRHRASMQSCEAQLGLRGRDQCVVRGWWHRYRTRELAPKRISDLRGRVVGVGYGSSRWGWSGWRGGKWVDDGWMSRGGEGSRRCHGRGCCCLSLPWHSQGVDVVVMSPDGWVGVVRRLIRVHFGHLMMTRVGGEFSSRAGLGGERRKAPDNHNDRRGGRMGRCVE